MLILGAVHRLTDAWSARRLLFGILLIVIGFVITGMRGPDSGSSWLFSGAVVGVALLASYLLVVRFSLQVVLIAVGVGQVLAAVKHGITAPFPGNVAGTGVGIILVGAGTLVWTAFFSKRNRPEMPKE